MKNAVADTVTCGTSTWLTPMSALRLRSGSRFGLSVKAISKASGGRMPVPKLARSVVRATPAASCHAIRRPDSRGLTEVEAKRLLIRGFFQEVVNRVEQEIVVEHLGMIDKFQGDAVMVVFGAPDPIDDHAERALRCAIAMQRRQAELNAEGWGTDAVDGLHIGVGVNTGQVSGKGI